MMNPNCEKSKLEHYTFYSKLSIFEIEKRTGKMFHETYPELEERWIIAIDSKDYREIRKIYNEICNICESLEGRVQNVVG